jgi:hypothetical protein
MRIAIAISANSLPPHHRAVIRASSGGTTVRLRQGDALMKSSTGAANGRRQLVIGLALLVVMIALPGIPAAGSAILHAPIAAMDRVDTEPLGRAIGGFAARNPLISIPVLGAGVILLVRADRRRARLSREAAAPPGPPPG